MNKRDSGTVSYQIDHSCPYCGKQNRFASGAAMINDDVCMTDLGAPINSPLGFMCVAADMAELIEVILHVVDLPIKVTPEMIWVPAPRKRFASRPYWVRYISTSDK